MGLRSWVLEIDSRPVATPATPATPARETGELSQLSQLSQGLAGEQARHAGGQLSQLSQPFDEARAHDSDDGREAFQERAAIMEFDSGLTREEAERRAAAEISRQHAAASAAAKLEAWGDMRPCTWCRNLTRGGRCLAASRGELRQARDWQPTFPNQPMRCVGYLPTDADPDRAQGRERWRDLVDVQSRRREL